jgi:hypothetical protein
MKYNLSQCTELHDLLYDQKTKMADALDDSAQKREGYKISQVKCADHVLHIESLETRKREQET